MVKKSKVISLFGVPVIGILLLFGNIDLLMSLIVLIWISIVLWFSTEYEEHIFFICFLCSFFIFLVSGDLVEQIFHTEYWMRFSDSQTVHSRICILISLISLFVGYVATKSKLTQNYNEKLDDNNSHIDSVRQTSRIFFLITYIPLICVAVERVIFSNVFGYDELYLSYYSVFPKIFVKIGDFAPISLCIFLGTMPLKKTAKLPITLFFLYAISGLFTGQRGTFIYNSAFLLAYIIFRNYAFNYGETWINKKKLFILGVSMPFLLAFLMALQFIRNGDAIAYNSVSEALVAFFTNIGSASKIIKLGYAHESQLTSFKFYSLGDTLTYLKYSDVFTFITGTTAPKMHTAEYALGCNNFGEILTYLSYPNQYIAGYGLGSSFIAELYADFGYIGITIGSFIYGVLFKKMSKMNPESYVWNFMKLFAMLNIIKAPRGEYDKFIVVFVNVLNLMFIIGIYYISKIVEKRHNS